MGGPRTTATVGRDGVGIEQVLDRDRVCVLEGRTKDEPSHVIKIDPAWGPSGIATVLQGALAGARESARAEEIADAQESFVAIASHDLRTPVSTLRLLHDLFRSRLNASAEKRTPKELSDIEELLDIISGFEALSDD